MTYLPGSPLFYSKINIITLRVENISHQTHFPFSCLSLDIPFPRSTKCVRDFDILHLYLLVTHHTDTSFLYIPPSSRFKRYIKSKLSVYFKFTAYSNFSRKLSVQVAKVTLSLFKQRVE